MLLVIIAIAVTFPMKQHWWAYSDVFFAFMMVFTRIVALYLEKISPAASRKLDVWALVFGVLLVIALIAETIAYQFI